MKKQYIVKANTNTTYEEAIEDEVASALDSLGMELLGISFYSIDE